MARIEGALEAVKVISAQWAVTIILALYACYMLIQYVRDPLRTVPGPFWARFTRLWYLKAVIGGRFEHTNIDLHRKYGSVVRIAPNYYSIDDPEAIKTIYGHGKAFHKGKWYIASANPTSRVPDLFTDLDPDSHAVNRRNVASLYSMTSLVGMEPHVVDCTKVLVLKLREFATSRRVINLQVWFQYFAFDTIALITLNRRFGFLDTGEDNGGMISALHSYLLYITKVGIYHECHQTLMWILSKFSNGGMVYLGNFMRQQVEERQEQYVMGQSEKDPARPDDDFLTKLLRLHAGQPQKFSLEHVYTTCGTNIGAGSDTTSVSLAGILNCLIRNPATLRRLRGELDSVYKEKHVNELLSFKETQKLPYLQACIKEGLRMHPATGLPLVRVVPEGGATIASTFFPQGTEVGVNSWVAHANKQIFGPDAHVFRPERWLESAERTSDMNRYIMTFGAGSRTCIGKNISLLEISVLIPELVRIFDFTLVDSSESLVTENVWFVKQKNLTCHVSLRESESAP